MPRITRVWRQSGPPHRSTIAVRSRLSQDENALQSQALHTGRPCSDKLAPWSTVRHTRAAIRHIS
jgi:uncharacterized protein (DUF2336 family)